MPKFDLIAFTDAHMTRPHSISMPRRPSWYPSEASVVWTDEHGEERVAGGCARASFFRYNGMFADVSADYDAYTQWIFATGKGVENILVEEWKQSGIWVANNVDFYIPERGIHGEIDAVLRDPNTGENFGVEVKSFAGYNATAGIMGNKYVAGKPKDSQYLQTLVYTHTFREKLPYFKMIYYARDSGERKGYDISLVPDASTGVELLRPAINGKPDMRFTMQDIWDRYDSLANYHAQGVVPPPDYSKAWSAEKVERRWQIGESLKHSSRSRNVEVAKTRYANWKKSPTKNPIGDWQCNYCKYSEVCWGAHQDLIPTTPITTEVVPGPTPAIQTPVSTARIQSVE